MNRVEPEKQIQTLGQVCEINPPKPSLRAQSDDTPVTFIPMASVDEVAGTVATPQLRALGEVRSKSYKTFTSGDVLFAKITPCMENGKSAIVPSIESGLGFGSTEFHVLRTRQGIDARLIWHFVRQESLRREARENMTGSVGQARVPAAFLASVPIQLPDECEQSALANLLDAAVASGRSAEGHLAQARQTLVRFRQAILAAACSGRLTADWRNTQAPSETAEQLICRSQSGMADRTSQKAKSEPWIVPDWLDLPESWRWSPLSDLALIQGGIQKQPKRAPKATAYPYLRVANVGRGWLNLSEMHRFELFDGELETYRLQPGDLLYGIRVIS